MSHDANGLSQEQMASLRALLETRLAEVQRGLVTSTHNARPVDLNLSIGRLTRVDALQQQHMASAQKNRLQIQLEQIRQALARVANGTYGEELGDGPLDHPEALALVEHLHLGVAGGGAVEEEVVHTRREVRHAASSKDGPI